MNPITLWSGLVLVPVSTLMIKLAESASQVSVRWTLYPVQEVFRLLLTSRLKFVRRCDTLR